MSQVNLKPNSYEDSKNIVKSTLPPFDYPNISVAEFFAQRFAQHNPESIAFIDPITELTLTYGEFNVRIQEFASSLLELGITKTDSILLFADNSIDCAIAIFAAFYLAIPLVLLKPADGPLELFHRINDASITVLLFGTNKSFIIRKVLDSLKYSSSLAKLKIFIEFDAEKANELLLNSEITSGKVICTVAQVKKSGLGKMLNRIPYFAVKCPKTEHLLISYTSGSTGQPKGVVHSHLSYISTQINMTYPSSYYGQRIGMPFPFGHISGIVFMPAALYSGMTVIPFTTSDVDTVMKTIDRLRINHHFFSMSSINALVNRNYYEQYDLSCLKVLQYGGSKFPSNLLLELKDKYQLQMHEVYGSTEFMGHVKINDPKMALEAFEPGNVGTVVPNVEMKIVDLKSRNAIEANQTGEICFRGAACFVGYLNNEQATRDTIDQDGWYHTGDIGYYDERKCLFITDRLKELIKYKMWSVTPEEIEDFLYRYKGVVAVCIVGVRHLTDGYLIRAYVQIDDQNCVTENELIDYVQKNLGFHKRLRAGVRFIGRMPRTAVGKVDRMYFKNLVKDELLTSQVS